MEEEKVFLEDSCLETQTSYYTNGKIVTNLCGFELEEGKVITPDGCCVSKVGRMNVNAMGRSVFNPFRQGTGERYEGLYDTEHADVKHCKNMVIVTFRFSKKMQRKMISESLKDETGLIQAWLKSLKSETVWEQGGGVRK